MEKIPWWQSQTLRALIIAGVAQVVQMLGLTDTVTSEILTLKVDQLLDLVSLIATAYAAYARTTKANPPLTSGAAQKEVVKQAELKAEKQGGYAKVLLLASMALIAGGALTFVSGCAGTTAAYKAAQGVDQQAYVALEHYNSLVKEAIALKSKPGVPPEVINAIKAADTAVYPAVQRVNRARVAYNNIKNAQTEEELQLAVNDAVLLLADLVNAVKQARGAQ